MLCASKCEKEGWKAFVDSLPEESNPYVTDSAEWVDWSIGWHEARLATGEPPK